MSRTFHHEGCELQCDRHSQLTVSFNRRISDGITDMKNMTSFQVFKTTMQNRLERGREFRYANGLGILELDRKRFEFKTESRITKVDGSRPSSGIYVYTRPFRIESKGESSAENSHLGDSMDL
jgi:hypothetical protein